MLILLIGKFQVLQTKIQVLDWSRMSFQLLRRKNHVYDLKFQVLWIKGILMEEVLELMNKVLIFS
jgi:hypothetical protein